MTIELLACTRQVNKYASDSIGLNKLLSSTGIFALILSGVMILIVMIFYPAKSGTGIYVLVKIFMYMCVSSIILVFLHDGILKDQFINASKEADLSEMVANVTDKGSNSRIAFGGAGHKPVSGSVSKVESPVSSKSSPVSNPPSSKASPISNNLTDKHDMSQILGGRGQLCYRKPPVQVKKPFAG